MLYLLFFSMAVLFGYLAFVVAKFGIPPSISESYYLLCKGSNGIWFQIALLLTAFSIAPVLIHSSSQNTQFLAFIPCAALAFVAVSPMFKMELEGKVHHVSAYVCCGGLVLWQVFNASWIVPAACFVLSVFPIVVDKRYIWWMEIAAIVSIYVSLIFF